MIDIDHYYATLAKDEALTLDESLALLRELKHFREATAYLAECHAATLESLPKSASKSARRRHATICTRAAELLDGNAAMMTGRNRPDLARQRCLQAANSQIQEGAP